MVHMLSEWKMFGQVSLQPAEKNLAYLANLAR